MIRRPAVRTNRPNVCMANQTRIGGSISGVV
jgi:hypothetical protein